MGNAAGRSESDRVPTPVPTLNLAAGFAQLREELLAEITGVCESGYYVLGPKVAGFEQALAEYTGAKHTVGTSSGTDALLMSLMALNVGRGDEVIVPAFTFFATAGCVARVGARPVFCDIDSQTYNLDVGQVEESREQPAHHKAELHRHRNPSGDVQVRLPKLRQLRQHYGAGKPQRGRQQFGGGDEEQDVAVGRALHEAPLVEAKSGCRAPLPDRLGVSRRGERLLMEKGL